MGDKDGNSAHSSGTISKSASATAIDVTVLQTQAKTLVDFLKDKIYDVFEDNIPIDDIKELPNLFWRRLLGVVACSLMLSVFIYFVYTSKPLSIYSQCCNTISSFVFLLYAGYTGAITSKFVSLGKSGNCKFVQRPLTGTYLVATNGKWEGQVGFDYSLALYSIQLSNVLVTPEEFASYFVDLIQSDLQIIADLMADLTLAENLIFLQSGQAEITVSGNSQLLEFTPTPGFVYNREYVTVAYASWPPAICPYLTVAAVDVANSLTSTIINVDNFYQYCGNSINLQTLGYQKFAIPAQSFDLTFDSVTFITALAVNFQFRLLSSMVVINIPISVGGTAATTWTYNGLIFTAVQYYDPVYPAMDPMICIPPTAENEYLSFCMVRIGGYFFLPTTNSFGSDDAVFYGKPDFCNW